MKKHHLLLFSTITLCASLHAQELAPSLLTPGGGYTETVKGSLSWSIGEVAIETVTQGQFTLSEGFQQIEIDTNTIALPEDPAKLLLLIPNIITPNSDGNNDLFDPVMALRDFQIQVSEDQAEMTIVNRWGEVVAPATKPYRPWDGRSGQGVLLPQATYYFILVIHRSKDITVRGPVNLLR